MATRRRKRKSYIQQLKDEPLIVGKWPLANNKAHTVNYRQPFYVATLVWLLTILCYAVAISTTIYFLLNKNLQNMKYLGAAVALALLMTLVCLLFKKACRCPLCRATPLVYGRNNKHDKAFRIRPLTFSTTTFLTIITKNRFRCQHCGTPFILNQRKKLNK